MLHWTCVWVLITLFLPASRAFRLTIEIWVQESSMHDTVLEVSILGMEEPDLFAITDIPTGNDATFHTDPDGGGRVNYYRLWSETYTRLTAYRPVKIRGGTRETDGTWDTDCEIKIWQEPKALFTDDDLTIRWNLERGMNQDYIQIMNITCVGPKEGVAIDRD